MYETFEKLLKEKGRRAAEVSLLGNRNFNINIYRLEERKGNTEGLTNYKRSLIISTFQYPTFYQM